MGLKLHWSGSSALNAIGRVLTNPKFPEKFQCLPRKHPGVGQGRPAEEVGVMTGAPVATSDNLKAVCQAKNWKMPMSLDLFCICHTHAIPKPVSRLL